MICVSYCSQIIQHNTSPVTVVLPIRQDLICDLRVPLFFKQSIQANPNSTTFLSLLVYNRILTHDNFVS